MPLGFGIVGYGHMAEEHHRLIESLRGCRMVAACDRLRVRREVAAAKGARTYEDFGKFLKDPELNVVVVTTPSNSHCQFTMSATRAGKHVLTEKPMAHNVSEARRMIESARKHNVLLTVFHNRRYDGDVQAALKLLRSGKLGRVLAIERRINTWGTARGFGTAAFRQDWRIERAWGGGALNDFGPHLVDQILLMVDSTVESVFANLQQGVHAKDCDDYVCAMMRFANGINSLVEINFMSRSPLPSLRIIAEGATVQAEPGGRGALLVHWADGKRITRVGPPQTHGSREIYTSFVRAIGKKGRPIIEAEHALRVMKVMDAFRKSSKTGRAVAVETTKGKCWESKAKQPSKQEEST